jgi:hypothetical protein
VSIWPIAEPSGCPPPSRQKKQAFRNVSLNGFHCTVSPLFQTLDAATRQPLSEHTKWRLSVDQKHLGGALGEVASPGSVLEGHTAPLDRGGDRYSLSWKCSCHGAGFYVTQIHFEHIPVFRTNISQPSVGFFLKLMRRH